MRSSKTAGLVLALMLGVVSAGLAQQPGQGQRDGKTRQEWQGRKQHRDGFGMLMKGIELTAEQKTQLQALRSKHGSEAKGSDHSAVREQMRAARESGDTAALRQLRTQHVARMQQQRQAMSGEIRAILTPAQREIFDRNVTEAKARLEKHGAGAKQQRS